MPVKHQNRKTVNIEQDEWENLADGHNARLDEIDQTRKLLDMAKPHLTQKQFYIMELYLWMGKTQQEIADTLGVSLRNVEIHLARARARLTKLRK